MKIISVVSGKGGVGKTTICANLCAALRNEGHEVLAVDFDPQNSLRFHFGVNPSDEGGIVSSGHQSNRWKEAIIKTNEGCSVLPFGKITESERSNFEQAIATQANLLKEQLQSLGLSREAYVVIDTSGQLPFLKQALSVANLTIVVNIADAASYTTIPMINGAIRQYCEGRSDFVGSLYILNQIDRSRQLNGDIADIVTMQVSAENIALIHQDQSVQEALACRTNVLAYDPNCRATQDFKDASSQISEFMSGIFHSSSKRNSF
ncbi:MAG: cellulose biosynthesis protein BcsQ [Polynucleobacter sp.]|jgi:cellulose synthase operon protein YhjQ